MNPLVAFGFYISRLIISGMINKIGVLIVTYNSWPDTFICLDSLKNELPPRAKIYLIDTGDSVGMFEEEKGRYPFVSYVRTDSNLGYSGGNNLGIELALDAGCTEILIANPDVKFGRNAVRYLEQTLLSHPEYGAAGPIWRTLDTEQRMAKTIAVWSQKINNYLWSSPSESDKKGVIPTEALSGCCFLVTRRALEIAGVFDERFFMYWEEIDLCRRMNKAGIKQMVVPNALIWHRIHGGGDGLNAMRRAYYHYRNWLLFLSKHNLMAKTSRSEVYLNLLSSSFKSALSHPGQSVGMLRGGLLGIKDFHLGHFGPLDITKAPRTKI